MRARAGGTFKNVAVVGLGVGSLACYGHAGEHWSFFEIDPVVVRIATDPTKFRTMETCAKGAPIHLGDARLTLADESEKLDLLVIDAFTSDVVPVHLLTQEAFALYASRLAPHGAIVLNITNRNIELTAVVAGSAAANGLAMFDKHDPRDKDFDTTYKAAAEVAVVTRSPDDVSATLNGTLGWRRVEPNPDVRTWSDDYSNIVSAIWRKLNAPRKQSAAN